MKIYRLWEDNPMKTNKAKAIGMVLTPDDVNDEAAMAAWSYAIRYSAKGLDVADYDAAIKLFQERHPSWQFLPVGIVDLWYQAVLADNDTAESGF